MQLHTALRASSVALCSAVAGKTVSQTVFLLPFESFLKQTKIPPVWVVFLFGGEGEIRTLERCYPLRDFQSRALDQLRDFSTVRFWCAFLNALGYYITPFFDCQHKISLLFGYLAYKMGKIYI